MSADEIRDDAPSGSLLVVLGAVVLGFAGIASVVVYVIAVIS